MDARDAGGLHGRVREALSPLAEGADLQQTLGEAFEIIADATECESVGIRWSAGEDYPYLVTRGFGRDFIVREGPLCDRDSAGMILRHLDGTPQLACMCGAVIRGRTDPAQPIFTQGGSFWTNGTTALLKESPPDDATAIKTRNYCNEAGYESVALVPLRAGGEALGLLQLNSRTPGRFTRERIHECERVADVIAEAVAARGVPPG